MAARGRESAVPSRASRGLGSPCGGRGSRSHPSSWVDASCPSDKWLLSWSAAPGGAGPRAGGSVQVTPLRERQRLLGRTGVSVEPVAAGAAVICSAHVLIQGSL